MTRTTKRYRAALATPGYEKLKRYDIGTGLEVLGHFPKARFDETVELHIRLGIDPKKSDQMVRGSVALPHGIGQSRSVVVFAEGEAADAARAAGAHWNAWHGAAVVGARSGRIAAHHRRTHARHARDLWIRRSRPASFKCVIAR